MIPQLALTCSAANWMGRPVTKIVVTQGAACLCCDSDLARSRDHAAAPRLDAFLAFHPLEIHNLDQSVRIAKREARSRWRDQKLFCCARDPPGWISRCSRSLPGLALRSAPGRPAR